jgi:hypothetical protein
LIAHREHAVAKINRKESPQAGEKMREKNLFVSEPLVPEKCPDKIRPLPQPDEGFPASGWFPDHLERRHIPFATIGSPHASTTVRNTEIHRLHAIKIHTTVTLTENPIKFLKVMSRQTGLTRTAEANFLHP